MENDVNFEEVKLAADFLSKTKMNFSYVDNEGVTKDLSYIDVAYYIIEKEGLANFVSTLQSFSGTLPNDIVDNFWGNMEEGWQEVLNESGLLNKTKCESIW